MKAKKVACFTPYAFEKGEKIRIMSGPRRGDWEIIDLSDRTMTLKCPVSDREFEWNRFCYFLETKADEEWPRKD